MCTYLKNMEGYKLKDLKLKEFDSIQEMFDRAFKRVNTFEDFRTELVEGKEKRARTELIQEITNKQKVEDDIKTTELKQLVKIIPDEEEVAIDAIPLTVKSPMIGDLKTMFEPHVEDEVWRQQQEYKVLNWKLYNSYGVHSLMLQYVQIYMLAEKKYPLTPPTLSMMLEKKLKIEYESEMAYQLLKEFDLLKWDQHSPSKKKNLVAVEEHAEKPLRNLQLRRQTVGVQIRDTPGVSVSKRKAPVKTERSKGIELLSEAALLEEAQLKKAIKRSKRETNIHQAGGSSEGSGLELEGPDEQKGKSSDTSEGTGLIPGVPDVSKADSSKSEYESWGDSDDDNDDDDQQSDDEQNVPDNPRITMGFATQWHFPKEHQLTFSQYPDAKSMFAAIETRFGGNAATKKTLLKQQYENFSATSAESLDSIFNRLQKIVSRLAILGVIIAQEDLNLKFLKQLTT
ncbi:hypothetical protein Tco_0404036 [Tanacetum coccineum]